MLLPLCRPRLQTWQRATSERPERRQSLLSVVRRCASELIFRISRSEDDWWDDFRTRNRLIVLVLLAQIAAVGGGWWAGWWIAG